MNNSRRELTLRFLAQPTDANFGGNVHGGSAMKWLDQAGYACASAWSGRYCVTAFVGDINFHHSISVGHLIEVNARVIYTGNSSMHIAIDLFSGDPKDGKLSKAMHCLMVFVAVDEEGNSTPVPKWEAVSDSDKKLETYALRIMEVRQLNKQELDSLIDLPAKT